MDSHFIPPVTEEEEGHEITVTMRSQKRAPDKINSSHSLTPPPYNGSWRSREECQHPHPIAHLWRRKRKEKADHARKSPSPRPVQCFQHAKGCSRATRFDWGHDFLSFEQVLILPARTFLFTRLDDVLFSAVDSLLAPRSRSNVISWRFIHPLPCCDCCLPCT